MAKVYIVTEKELEQLLESLELSSMRQQNIGRHDPDNQKIQDVFRSFNYVVCGWINEVKK